MEIFKQNYKLEKNDYESIRERIFNYNDSTLLFFYPLLFPCKSINNNEYISSVIYTNTYSVQEIKKYNLYYSLFYIVNKNIWSIKKYYNIIENKLTDILDKNSRPLKYVDENILRKNHFSLYISLKMPEVRYEFLSNDEILLCIEDLINFANELGILSASIRKTKMSNNKFNLFSSTIQLYSFLSLSITNQLKLYHSWLKRKTMIITGSTGIGKSSEVPKLLFYIFTLFNGYSNYNVFSMEDYKNTGVMCLALPRKLLVESTGMRYSTSLGLNLANNPFISLRFKDIIKNELINNEILNTKFIIGTTQSLYRYIRICDLLICDEVHEHTTQTDILLSIAKSKNILSILISATIDEDKEIINSNFPNNIYIDIKGPTIYNIKVLKEDLINKNNMNKKDIVFQFIKKNINDIYKYTEVGETTLIFLPTKAWLTSLKNELSYFKGKLLLLHKDVVNYQESVIKFVETNKHIRHLILSTPIAESSITINSLKYVIDTGLFYNSSYGFNRIDMISFASHVQRKGRVGRNSIGVYKALYDFDSCSKLLRRDIDGERLFLPLLYIHHFLSDSLKRDPTMLEIKNSFIFPPNKKERIEKVYNYLKDIQLTNINYTSLVIQGLTCNIIEFLFLYYKYKNTEKFIELQKLEELDNIKDISADIIIDIINLKKFVKYNNGVFTYLFFNDEEKSIPGDKKLTNGDYILIKYNRYMIRI